MSGILARIRQRLQMAWANRTGLTTIAVYLAGVEILLLLLCGLARLAKYGTGPTVLSYVVGFSLAICVLLIAFRWFRRMVMWRLRNRLIVTYVFIGVIPVILLVSIAVIAAYLFAGQFATFVITSDVHSELKSLAAANRAEAEAVGSRIRGGIPVDAALRSLRSEGTERSVTVWVQAPSRPARAYTIPPGAAEVPLPPQPLQGKDRAIVSLPDGLHLYAWSTLTSGRDQVTVISTQPLAQPQLQRVAAELGEITLDAPNFQAADAAGAPDVPNGISIDTDTSNNAGDQAGDQKDARAEKKDSKPSVVIQNKGQVLVRSPKSHKLVPALPPISAGTLPLPHNRLDREVWFGMPFDVSDWNTGQSASALLRVRTRPSLLYNRLFMALGQFANLIFILLAGIAIFFALIELVALITGIRLTRTMTRSVAALYTATQHINRGDLSHRIRVKSQDQLAALEGSFNSMTESLEKLIAEQKEKQRMESELAIAQEVQAQLFPREASQMASLEVHGVCRPARTVSGDYYDFLQLGPEKLGIAVGDISGKGISAALLMATIHSAVRVYEFGRMPEKERLLAAGAAAVSVAGGAQSLSAAGAIQSPAEVLGLLNRHLFHSTPPEKYATLFLGLWDGYKRRLAYSNGGHLPPLVIGVDGSVRKLEQGGMVIGLFDEMQWEEGSVDLRPGDLFLAYSDGVTEPENDFGEFGEDRLIELVKENRHLPLARITDTVLAAVHDWIGASEQPDDVTLVLARAQ